MEVIVKPCSTVLRVRLALVEANNGCIICHEGMKFEVGDFNMFLQIVWRAYSKLSREADGWSLMKVPLVVYVGKYRIRIKPEVVNGIAGLRYGVVD